MTRQPLSTPSSGVPVIVIPAPLGAGFTEEPSPEPENGPENGVETVSGGSDGEDGPAAPQPARNATPTSRATRDSRVRIPLRTLAPRAGFRADVVGVKVPTPRRVVAQFAPVAVVQCRHRVDDVVRPLEHRLDAVPHGAAVCGDDDRGP